MRYDYSYLYQEDQHLIKPKFKAFHHTQDSSYLYFQIESQDVLYGKISGDTNSKARVLCKYKLYGKKGERDIIDSATTPLVSMGNNESNRVLQAYIKMKVPDGELYPLEIRFRDVYRDLNVVYYHWLDKRPNGNAQYFLIKQGKRVLVEPFLDEAISYELIKSNLLKDSAFSLHSTNVVYEMTPPPFATEIGEFSPPMSSSTEDFKLTTFPKTINAQSKIQWLQAKNDSTLRPFYYFQVRPHFPQITKYEEMIGPLRYISTSSEFKKLSNAVNPKKELDQFWLKLGKETNRAEKMIREFYRRVEIANRYFSDYREGWKTDRGIIFIVYGEPTSIFKDLNQEIWIYGEENHILSVKFEFQLFDNPLSRNDYRLKRSSDFKNNWYRAVDNWRQAKIY
jgi:GWxTD domain-containing protein